MNQSYLVNGAFDTLEIRDNLRKNGFEEIYTLNEHFPQSYFDLKGQACLLVRDPLWKTIKITGSKETNILGTEKKLNSLGLGLQRISVEELKQILEGKSNGN